MTWEESAPAGGEGRRCKDSGGWDGGRTKLLARFAIEIDVKRKRVKRGYASDVGDVVSTVDSY